MSFIPRVWLFTSVIRCTVRMINYMFGDAENQWTRHNTLFLTHVRNYRALASEELVMNSTTVSKPYTNVQ